MSEAVILSGARTPIARANKGSLVDVDAFELGQIAVSAAIERSGVDTAEIDDLVLAESLQGGGVIGRYVAVELGLTHIPGMADNRHCAAGLSAVQIAAGSIRAGMDQLVVAGGTESMSGMPQVLKSIPTSKRDYQMWMSPANRFDYPDAPPFDMPFTVGENTAREARITRQDVDEWAYLSHQRAHASTVNGWFADEIVPVKAPQADGSTKLVDTDEQPRPESTLEKLASLPVLHPELENPTVTAGNSAGVNDAAAALVLASDEYAKAHGHAPLARVVSWASVGVDPARTGLAPTLAIPKALERAGMKVSDIDLFEVNEAFCSVAVAASRILEIDPEILNVNGSGCGLGHPIACTGSRMVVTMLNELRRRGGTHGVVAMCAGGGMGSALVLELL
jgi:acetyl-CoA C-acetyltransferase